MGKESKIDRKIIVGSVSYVSGLEKGEEIQVVDEGIIQNLEDQSIDTIEIPTSSIIKNGISKKLLALLEANHHRRIIKTKEKQKEPKEPKTR